MTGEDLIEEARQRFERVCELVDDDESAHAREDDLHIFALRMIRDGQVDSLKDAQALADIALQTLDLKFARWCA